MGGDEKKAIKKWWQEDWTDEIALCLIGGCILGACVAPDARGLIISVLTGLFAFLTGKKKEPK